MKPNATHVFAAVTFIKKTAVTRSCDERTIPTTRREPWQKSGSIAAYRRSAGGRPLTGEGNDSRKENCDRVLCREHPFLRNRSVCRFRANERGLCRSNMSRSRPCEHQEGSRCGQVSSPRR